LMHYQIFNSPILHHLTTIINFYFPWIPYSKTRTINWIFPIRCQAISLVD